MELGEGVEIIDVCAFKDTKAVIYVPKSIKRIEYNAFSKDDIVFFECGENDFRGHYEVIRSEDYPDSYYRGPSMGVDERVDRYYEDGATLLFNKTHQDFLDYIKEHN